MENTTRYGFACNERIIIVWNQREGNMELYDVNTLQLLSKKFIKKGIFVHQIQSKERLHHQGIRIFYATNRQVHYVDMELSNDVKQTFHIAHYYVLYPKVVEALCNMNFDTQSVTQALQYVHQESQLNPTMELEQAVALTMEHLLTLPTRTEKKPTRIGYTKNTIDPNTLKDTRKARLYLFYLELAKLR
eukprot:CAMPEP_0117429368 /NCGR_PEP_ID=MMETSP0758-20121206/8932_1 /TAXON_ID=63605 /ORGANISM="Percolomonas cosmopolitus, Strain AE-1 (ATCC 50343)" /LENGTH=188 /DNA_ID=CAMNT_0005216367 /DNA_START=802 /DNA_END=1365 /DNA_ORIENTATION=+